METARGKEGEKKKKKEKQDSPDFKRRQVPRHCFVHQYTKPDQTRHRYLGTWSDGRVHP